MFNKSLTLAHTVYGLAKAPMQDPVIILHSLLGSRLNWRSTARRLNKHGFGNVICVDARNHGDSPHSNQTGYKEMATDVLHFISGLNARNVSVIGHSMGGKIAMTAALLEPTMIDRLVVVDVAPNLLPNAADIQLYTTLMRSVDLKQRMAEVNGNLPALRAALMKDWEGHIKSNFERGFILANLTENKQGDAIWKANVEVIAENIKTFSCFPFTVGKDKIFNNRPSLFIAGGKSPFLRPEAMTDVLYFFPKAERVEIPNATHWVHTDAPDLLCETISSFLTK